jgi:hypothetical protein
MCIGPGRVGRDIFDVHALSVADKRAAVIVAGRQDRAQLLVPHARHQPDVDEAGTRKLGSLDIIERSQLGCEQACQRARIGAGALGEHHRRVGREIAMRGVARRLDGHSAPLDPGRKLPFGFKLVERRAEMRGKTGVKGQGRSCC